MSGLADVGLVLAGGGVTAVGTVGTQLLGNRAAERRGRQEWERSELSRAAQEQQDVVKALQRGVYRLGVTSSDAWEHANNHDDWGGQLAAVRSTDREQREEVNALRTQVEDKALQEAARCMQVATNKVLFAKNPGEGDAALDEMHAARRATDDRVSEVLENLRRPSRPPDREGRK